MNFYTTDHPIIACSTGTSSNTAIAVIRLSGFAKLESLQSFFSFNFKKVKPRTSHLTNIVFNEHVYDQGLLVYFPEGASYTGERVLELSIHGNQLNVQRILRLFVDHAGFSLAGPGEFTYRALKNKKLTLSQVEGLDLLLNANSGLMLNQGLDILQGELHEQYGKLYNSFLQVKSAVELSIDFSEDVGEEESKALFDRSFGHFMKILSSLYARTQGDVSALLSPEVVLVGQTNAGKSSLFNLLLKHDRSIVSAIAGTTRDYISEVVHIDGTNFKLVDTAGIRDSSDEIENIGIDRAFEILKRSFFKVLIVNPFETDANYLKRLSSIDFDLLILSHSDKDHFFEKVCTLDLSMVSTNLIAAASFEAGSIGPFDIKNLSSGPIGPKSKSGSIEPQKISAPIEPSLKSGLIEPKDVSKTGPIEPKTVFNFGPIEPKDISQTGPIEPKSVSVAGPIEPVVKEIISSKFSVATQSCPILLERHRDVINKIYLKSKLFSTNLSDLSDAAIISSELNLLANDLSELIGIVSPDQVLNSIFSNFCIGK